MPAMGGSADTFPPPVASEAPETCTYTTYAWSLKQKGPVDHRKVAKAYAEVSDDERDPADPRCTVCEEDQRLVDPGALGIENVGAVYICRYYAESFENALRSIAADPSFQIRELTGYRTGRTRGPVVHGKRTLFSNHSYGTAVDINAKFNGLYADCNTSDFSPKGIKDCRRSVGGIWDPRRNPKFTITKDGVVYNAFTTLVKWRWGGEIAGQLKDFMHFSITGY